jgi:hypothetical protein
VGRVPARQYTGPSRASTLNPCTLLLLLVLLWLPRLLLLLLRV